MGCGLCARWKEDEKPVSDRADSYSDIIRSAMPMVNRKWILVDA
jgi:hypothetical protein